MFGLGLLLLLLPPRVLLLREMRLLPFVTMFLIIVLWYLLLFLILFLVPVMIHCRPLFPLFHCFLPVLAGSFFLSIPILGSFLRYLTTVFSILLYILSTCPILGSVFFLLPIILSILLLEHKVLTPSCLLPDYSLYYLFVVTFLCLSLHLLRPVDFRSPTYLVLFLFVSFLSSKTPPILFLLNLHLRPGILIATNMLVFPFL